MLIDSVLTMKTSETLLSAIRRVSTVKLSPNDILEQRVSFVFGSLDEKNGVTREHVRRVILDQVGSTEVA